MTLELYQAKLEETLALESKTKGLVEASEKSLWEARAALQEVIAFRVSLQNKIAQLKREMS